MNLFQKVRDGLQKTSAKLAGEIKINNDCWQGGKMRKT
jgi:hypothetical protein